MTELQAEAFRDEIQTAFPQVPASIHMTLCPERGYSICLNGGPCFLDTPEMVAEWLARAKNVHADPVAFEELTIEDSSLLLVFRDLPSLDDDAEEIDS